MKDYPALWFRNTHGESLIGRNIMTEAIGEYPGGVATEIDLGTDPHAPEIVMNVKHPTWKSDTCRLPGADDGCIGIFENERVRFA